MQNNSGWGQQPPQQGWGQIPQNGGWQQQFPQQPVQSVPQQSPYYRPPKHRLNVLEILLIVVALGFLAWYLVQTLVPQAAPYATISAGTLGARFSGECLIVRNEVPYDAEGVSSVEYVAEEGSTMQRNLTICNVYSSGYSTREMAALQTYRDQIRDYQLQLLGQETTYDARMARAESDVLERAQEVRNLIAGARGSLSNQEKLLDAAIDARQQYFREKYATDQRLSRLLDDESAQLQRIDSWTKTYTTTTECVISFYSDGYEHGLTMMNDDTFSPQQVRRMYNGELPEGNARSKGRTTIYRTVQDGAWDVLFLAKDLDWNPVVGQTYELQLERFENTVVSATVEDFTRTGGELLVRLSVYGSVKPVLYVRTCQAELGDYVSTLMVPARALFSQDGSQGVVVVNGSTQAYVPVNVVLRHGDYAFISPVQQGILFEGQTVRLF